MDAIDPRVDYLLVDALMRSNEYAEVLRYCKKMKCCAEGVINIWFDASQPEGIMIGDQYFDEYRLEFDQPVIPYGQFYFPSKPDIKIVARSGIAKYTCTPSISRLLIRSATGNGQGFITSINGKVCHEESLLEVECCLDFWSEI